MSEISFEVILHLNGIAEALRNICNSVADRRRSSTVAAGRVSSAPDYLTGNLQNLLLRPPDITPSRCIFLIFESTTKAHPISIIDMYSSLRMCGCYLRWRGPTRSCVVLQATGN